MASTSGDIADEIVTAVGALGLSPTPAVRKRKQPLVAEGDTFPLVLVAVGDPGEAVEPLGDFGAGLAFLHTYTASCAVAFKNSGKVGENASLREWRETIRDRFHKPGDLTGVSDVRPGGKPLFDMAALPQGYDWSVVTFQVDVIE